LRLAKEAKGGDGNDSLPWSVGGGGEEGEVGKNGCDEKVEWLKTVETGVVSTEPDFKCTARAEQAG
jgi:hypothetical protein